MNIPKPNKGEVYVGSIINKAGTSHHIYLLPGDKDDGTWQDAMDWAKELGGDLPTRVEQALLFQQSKDEFKEDWYWSNTTHASNSEYAWCQNFTDGDQNYYDKYGSRMRARAVRRVAI